MSDDVRLVLLGACFGGMIGMVLGSAVERIDAPAKQAAVLVEACGPCDHVAECGAFVCAVGKEGWQKKERQE